MGLVFKARDTLLDRDVALKVISTDLLKDAEAVGAFVREAKSASALNHPNIITVHDLLFEAEGAHFIVMELVEGKTLRQLIRKKGVEPKQLFAITSQVGEALSAAHNAGIVHRELKPENVMVRSDGHVKVVDFGLAKLVARKKETSFDGPTPNSTLPYIGMSGGPNEAPAEKTHITGTLPYMSPEQLRGDTVDQRSDIFSFGVVVYEMATGRQPFQGRTTAEIITNILEVVPPPLTDLSGAFPEKLQDIVSKCLDKDPSERYQHIEDVVVDLRRLKRLTDSGRGIPEQPRRPDSKVVSIAAVAASKYRLRLLASLLVIATLVAITAYIVINEPPRPILAVKWEKAIGNASLTPNGTLIAFESDASGQSEIYVVPTNGGEPVKRADGFGDKFEPRVSPDGQEILYWVSGSVNEIWSTPVLRGNTKKFITNGSSADWSPDGKKIAFVRSATGQPGNLVTFDLATGEDEVIFTSKYEEITHVRWSPDRKSIFFMPEEGAALVDPESRRFTAIKNIPDEESGDFEWSPDSKYLYFSTQKGGEKSLWKLNVPDGKPEIVAQGLKDAFDPMPLRNAPVFFIARGITTQEIWVSAGKLNEPSRLVAQGWATTPMISPDYKTVSYVSSSPDAPGYGSLWTVGITSGDPIQRSLENTCFGRGVWSPDSRRVAYSFVSNSDDHYHIKVISLSSKETNELKVTNYDAFVTDWRNDGSGLLFVRTIKGKSELMTMSLPSQETSLIGKDFLLGRYSKDGRWILAVGPTDLPRRSGVWVMDATGGNPQRIVSQDVGRAVWAINDEAIIYSLSQKKKGQVELWKMPLMKMVTQLPLKV